jgi:CubicO group peptidase (beta-lactamase class C family)
MIKYVVRFLIFVGLALLGCEGQLTRPASKSIWPQASPTVQGIDNDILQHYKAEIERGQYGPIHSWLIWRNQFLVAEFYFSGNGPDDLHPIYSVSKSITATLVGQALQLGKMQSLQYKVLDSFPEYEYILAEAADKANITISDLLTMRSGLLWDESSTPYIDARNSCFQMMTSNDWIGFLLTRPMAAAPGATFRYNTGCTVLLGELLARQTKQSVPQFAEENLFTPIGISHYLWESAPHGVTNCGGGLHLFPRDMLRIGVLYLQKGVWQNKQVIPGSWIDQSLDAHLSFTNGYQYGYQWWRKQITKDGQLIPLHIAWGYGGQFILLLPTLNIVMVSTGADYESREEGVLKFIDDFVKSAVTTK